MKSIKLKTIRLMKKILFLLAFLLVGLFNSHAQDTVITNQGDVLQVYDIEISETSIFYKKAPGASVTNGLAPSWIIT